MPGLWLDVSILGLVDKGLRLFDDRDLRRSGLVSILGLVDKGLRLDAKPFRTEVRKL